MFELKGIRRAMLLRSITKHVKDQNWFAVALDFFIVVVGILIAFQITNWNEERAERTLEAEYTQRLHREVLDLETVRKKLVEERRQSLAKLRSATKKLMTSDIDSLSPTECFWLIYNPKATNPTDDLPLIIELLSSGRFSIFTNKNLEKALGDYLITRSRARDSRQGIVEGKPNLDEKYPQFHQIRSSIISAFEAEIMTDEVLADQTIICDEDGMRSSQTYLNDLAHLEALFYYHIRDNENVSAALARLHSALDEILTVDHGEDK